MRTQSWILNLLFVISLVLSINIESVAVKSVQDAMIEDLEVAKYNLSIKYAPYEWKNELFGWNLQDSFEKAKARILYENPKTSKEYHKIFNEFLASTQDYHVHPIYYSTSLSTFPMQVKGVDGHYYCTEGNFNVSMGPDESLFFDISQSDLDLLAKNFKDVKLGDEIIAIDGKPIREVIEELIDENFNGDRSPTGYTLAERNLFLRRGKMGQRVFSGTFEATFIHQGEKKPFTRTLPWFYVPEWIPDHVLKVQCEKEAALISAHINELIYSGESVKALDQLLVKDFSVGIAKEMVSQKLSKIIAEINGAIKNRAENNFEQIEDSDYREKGFLPPLGKILWESNHDDYIYAYLYQHPSGKNVGYLYLSTFDASGMSAENLVNEIMRAVKVFNNRADALVFDITNNVGGNLMFMYAVLSVLTDRPLKVPSHRELLIQEDILRAAKIYKTITDGELTQSGQSQETLSGYPITPKVTEQILSYAFTIMQTWESGDRLTQPLYLFGMDEVMPHPKVQFKKPILVLTNEYNFSCADFFPAILQDNKRARIFGKKTAGAGGYVKRYPHTSRFGVQAYTLTASIAYRSDGRPLENVGVNPDVPYEITVKDLRNDYVSYIRKVNAEIKRLLK